MPNSTHKVMREAGIEKQSNDLSIWDTCPETKLLNSAKPWATQCPREFHTEHVLLHLCQMTQLATCTRKIANTLHANMANTTEQDQIQDNPVDWVDVQEKEDGLALRHMPEALRTNSMDALPL